MRFPAKGSPGEREIIVIHRLNQRVGSSSSRDRCKSSTCVCVILHTHARRRRFRRTAGQIMSTKLNQNGKPIYSKSEFDNPLNVNLTLKPPAIEMKTGAYHHHYNLPSQG